MPAGSQPLAFAELALGGLLITSAITGESIGELLTKGVTPEGKKRLHAQRSGTGESSASAGSGSGGGSPSSPAGTGSGSGFTVHTARDPRKIQLPKQVIISGGPDAVTTATLGKWEKQLENFYHKQLTNRQKGELAFLAQANEGKWHKQVAP